MALKKTHLMLCTLVVLGLALSSCDTGVTEPDDIIFPQSDVSYGRHVQPLFDISCAYSGCHNEIDQAAGLSLKSYVALFRNPGIVRPGDSTGSVLWQIVSQRLPHFAFPMVELINGNHEHGIALWIQEGARNN